MVDEEKSSSNYQSPFDTIRHTDEHMDEYWSARELHKILGYTEDDHILDWMNSDELIANSFRASQTRQKLEREQIQGKERANRLIIMLEGLYVRQLLRPEEPCRKICQYQEKVFNKSNNKNRSA